MSDLHDELRQKQREMDNLRCQARNDPDATFRTHTVAEDFSGESEDPDPADLRQALADMFGLDPSQFEGMEDADLRTIYEAETAEGEREHTGAHSPSADMRGVGGDTSGESSDKDTEREHTAETPPGYGPNGYAKKGREAWRARGGRTATDLRSSRREHTAESGWGPNGYPIGSRNAWHARGGDRTPSERLDENRREHSSGEAAGKVAKRRQKAVESDPRDLRDRDLSS